MPPEGWKGELREGRDRQCRAYLQRGGVHIPSRGVLTIQSIRDPLAQRFAVRKGCKFFPLTSNPLQGGGGFLVAAELLKHQHSSSAPVSAASLNSAQLQSKMSATVAFKWPSASTGQLYCFDTSRSRYPGPQSLEFRRVLSANSTHKRQPW